MAARGVTVDGKLHSLFLFSHFFGLRTLTSNSVELVARDVESALAVRDDLKTLVDDLCREDIVNNCLRKLKARGIEVEGKSTATTVSVQDSRLTTANSSRYCRSHGT